MRTMKRGGFCIICTLKNSMYLWKYRCSFVIYFDDLLIWLTYRNVLIQFLKSKIKTNYQNSSGQKDCHFRQIYPFVQIYYDSNFSKNMLL